LLVEKHAAIIVVLGVLILGVSACWIDIPACRSSRLRLTSHRLGFRYGLRDLLIAVTLVAVVLGIFSLFN
jgi:hypothetical protein